MFVAVAVSRMSLAWTMLTASSISVIYAHTGMDRQRDDTQSWRPVYWSKWMTNCTKMNETRSQKTADLTKSRLCYSVWMCRAESHHNQTWNQGEEVVSSVTLGHETLSTWHQPEAWIPVVALAFSASASAPLSPAASAPFADCGWWKIYNWYWMLIHATMSWKSLDLLQILQCFFHI